MIHIPGQSSVQNCKEMKNMEYSIIKLPSFDVNDREAVITEICVENKQKIVAGQKLFIVENTKAVNEIVAEEQGYILIVCKKLETKKTGDSLAYIFPTIEKLQQFKPEHIEKQAREEVNATKKAIDLAQDLGIDIREVAGRVTENVVKVRDVQLYFDTLKRNSEKTSNHNHVFKYDRERVVIIGAGNGAEVVIDLLRDDPEKDIVGLVDDHVKKMVNYDYKMYECGINEFPDQSDRDEYDTVIISIGATLKSMQLRKKIFEKYKSKGLLFTNVVSKSAEIRRGVKLGIGNLIGAQSYIGTLTEIGDNNSIGYGTYIGHHNLVGSNNLIAPGFISSGSVEIGNSCIIPAGVVTRNCVKIGDNAVLPVGYRVVNSIEKDTVVQQKLCNGFEENF